MASNVLEVNTALVSEFAFEGGVIEIISPYGEGHINDTIAVSTEDDSGRQRRYIIQQINQYVFPKPAEVMENIARVTEHLREQIILAGGDPARETLNVIPTKDGKLYYLDADGNYWRAYDFIEDTVTLQQARTPHDFYNSARAFGRFQQLLANYPADTLHETIENFHHTPSRYKNFLRAVEADVAGRVAGSEAEIEFLKAREADCHILVDLEASGDLPLRVTHNDTKLNNVLMDQETGEGICVVDLDTVMPGLAAYDYGDSIRFGASTALEDEPDLDKVHLSQELFEAYTKGYLEVAGSALTAKEKETLIWGAKIITMEIGMRFLTDHLEGDIYFKTARENHNLDRARTQFKLVQEMEEQWDELVAIVERYS